MLKSYIKAQSAMEYLMTYGWAILVVAIVLVTLSFSGVFNGNSITTSSGCIAQTGFLCAEPSLATNGTLNVTIGTTYTQITLTGIACANSINPPTTFSPLNQQISLNNGQETSLNFQCPISSNLIGTPFTGTLWIQYDKGSTIGQIAEVGTAIVKSNKMGSVLSVFISPNPAGVDRGNSITLTISPSGGAAPYTYQWYTAPSAGTCSTFDTLISGATTNSYLDSSTSNTYYCAIISDASNQIVNSLTDLVTINPVLEAGAISPFSPQIVIGSGVTLIANQIGGTPPYSYQWYTAPSAGTCSGSDSIIIGATSNAYTAYPTSNTYYCSIITDSYGESSNSLTNLVTVYPILSNPSYTSYTSSSTPSVTVDPGNQIYICTIGEDYMNGETLTSESWAQSANTLHASVGIQENSICSASISSATPSIIGAYGVNVPTMTNTIYSFSSTQTPSPTQISYKVTNSINTVVIAMAGSISGIGSVSLPSGCTEEMQQSISNYGSDGIYYAICVNQTPGTYVITYNPAVSGWDYSMNIFVYENPISEPIQNPTYYVSSSTSTSITAAPGNQVYICTIGEDYMNGETLTSESWASVTNTLYGSIGTQSNSICSASISSATPSIIGAYGVNVPTMTNTIYSFSSTQTPSPTQILYKVTNSINTVVIAISLSTSGNINNVVLPSGCTEEMQQNLGNWGADSLYYAICVNQTPGTYVVSYSVQNYPYASSSAIFVYENPISEPIQNPTYYVSSANSISVTAAPGNQVYICTAGSENDGRNTELTSESWAQATNTLYSSIGTQTGNICSADLSILGDSIIGGYGVNVPSSIYTTNTISYTSTPTSSVQLGYTVTNTISTVVIAIAASDATGIKSVILPQGCNEELKQNDLSQYSGDAIYYAICVNQIPNTYSVTYTPNYNWPSSMAIFVYENP